MLINMKMKITKIETLVCNARMRNWIFVKPNEPVIQLPYIARHVDATRHAYNLEHVQEVDFLPNRPGDPLPTAEALLAAARRAASTYRQPTVWKALVKNAMAEDFSWDASAREYATLYRKILRPQAARPPRRSR